MAPAFCRAPPDAAQRLAEDPRLKMEQKLVEEIVALWGYRLMDISWFMCCMN